MCTALKVNSGWPIPLFAFCIHHSNLQTTVWSLLCEWFCTPYLDLINIPVPLSWAVCNPYFLHKGCGGYDFYEYFWNPHIWCSFLTDIVYALWLFEKVTHALCVLHMCMAQHNIHTICREHSCFSFFKVQVINSQWCREQK